MLHSNCLQFIDFRFFSLLNFETRGHEPYHLKNQKNNWFDLFWWIKELHLLTLPQILFIYMCSLVFMSWTTNSNKNPSPMHTDTENSIVKSQWNETHHFVDVFLKKKMKKKKHIDILVVLLICYHWMQKRIPNDIKTYVSRWCGFAKFRFVLLISWFYMWH